eukprot:16764-Amphidinium_carterae.1
MKLIKADETELPPHILTDNHTLGQRISYLQTRRNRGQTHLLLLSKPQPLTPYTDVSGPERWVVVLIEQFKFDQHCWGLQQNELLRWHLYRQERR